MLNRTFGCVRVVWNRTLEARRERYAAQGKSTSYAKPTAADRVEENPGPGVLLRGIVGSVAADAAPPARAFARSSPDVPATPGSNPGNSRQSAHYTRSAFPMHNGELPLAKTTTPLQFVWSLPELDLSTLNPTMVIISRDPDDHRTYLRPRHHAPRSPADDRPRHRVDLGIKDFAVTSDGERIANPRHLERKARNLARYQRRLARRRKLREPAQGQGQGRPRPPQGPQCPARLPAPPQHPPRPLRAISS